MLKQKTNAVKVMKVSIKHICKETSKENYQIHLLEWSPQGHKLRSEVIQSAFSNNVKKDAERHRTEKRRERERKKVLPPLPSAPNLLSGNISNDSNSKTKAEVRTQTKQHKTATTTKEQQNNKTAQVHAQKKQKEGESKLKASNSTSWSCW